MGRRGRRLALSALLVGGTWACGARTDLDVDGVAFATNGGGRDAAPPPRDASPESAGDVVLTRDATAPDVAGDAVVDQAADGAPDADAASCGNRCIPDASLCVEGGVRVDGSCLPIATAIPAPRPTAPLSTAMSASHSPIFHWALAPGDDGARVELYRDRACTMSVVSFQSTGMYTAPAYPLAAGVYFWRLAGTNNGVVGTERSPVWELFVGPRSAPLASSWGTTVDVNGDGYSDVVIGASDAVTLEGGVYVYLGGPSGLSTMATSLAPPAKDSAFGESVASAGDVNGDGFADVIIGSPTFGNSAYLYLGGKAGLSTTPVTLTTGAEQFGYNVASAGDVNGDGYADVIVQATGEGSNSGLAYLYLGGAGGLSTTPTSFTSPGAVSVASAGDVNGDGFGDVIVGTLTFADGGFVGGASLYLGGPSGLSAPVALPAPSDAVEFGHSVTCAGDVNGDGFADVLVGAAGSGGVPTSVFLFTGSAGGLTSAPTSLSAPNLVTSFGDTVAGAGDADGDGFADVLVAVTATYGGIGDVYLYRGGSAGIETTPIILSPAGSAAHVSVAGAGDVNGDGFTDILVGTIVPDTVSLYLGAATVPGTATPVLDQYPDVMYQTFFGFAVQ